MPRSFYDVVVLGTEVGSLVSGALLARRGFRVLVIGQGTPPTTYTFGDFVLPRAPTPIAALDSPPLRRVFSELALSQVVKRRSQNPATRFQVVLPRRRLDFVADPAVFAAEVAREFPEATRAIEGFYQNLERVNGEIDRILEKDLVWPPDSFFERREFARASVHNPFAGHPDRVRITDLFAEFPPGHLFRTVVAAQARLGTRLDPERISPLEIARLHGAWARSASMLDGVSGPESGIDGLRQLLVEKIESHSGEVRSTDHVEEILLRRGRVAGVRLSGQDEGIGCTFVVHGGDILGLFDLAPDGEIRRRLGSRATEGLEHLRPRYVRYTLNVVIAAEGFPEGMARTVYVVRDPSFPLAEENLLQIDALPPDGRGRRVLTVGALVPVDFVESAAPGTLPGLRDRILAALRWVVPFLDRHLLLVDSPHDGGPPEPAAHPGGALAVAATPGSAPAPPPPSIAVEERALRSPKSMEPVWSAMPHAALGVAGLPVRLGVKNLFLAGPQVVPGLGLEGLFLAGWSAARLITRTDRKKERMRRELWAKMEI